MEIRRIQGGELPAAMDLCWRVFLKFEAPDYAPEGVEAFRAYLSDIEQVNHLTLFGAWEGQELLGVLAAEGSHIALFFVDPAFHRQGIGRLLFQAYLAEGGWGRVTVHSSPYAVEVYRQLGFFPTAEEQLSPDGIRYTPMVWEQTRKSPKYSKAPGGKSPPGAFALQRMKLVRASLSAWGGWSPAAFPAWMHWTIQSRFRAKFRMVCIPSASWRTSSGVLPWTMFQ